MINRRVWPGISSDLDLHLRAVGALGSSESVPCLQTTPTSRGVREDSSFKNA